MPSLNPISASPTQPERPFPHVRREHYHAFLFDCDGTLVDTMGLHFLAWQQTLQFHGLQGTVCRKRFHSLGGRSGLEVARFLAEWYQVPHAPDTLAEYKRSLFLSTLPGVLPIEPVVDFLREVAATHPVAVVSGGHRHAVDRSLEITGLRDLFDVIITPEDVAHGKPAPDSYLLAAERLGVAPERCLVFEDGEPGILAARAAGMDVVVIEDPFTAQQEADAQPEITASLG